MQALGVQFYNDEGELLDAREGAQVIKFIRRIDFSAIPQNFKDAHIKLMSDFSSKLYGKHSEIMKTYETHQMTREKAAEIDNLIWYFSELVKNEMKIAMGPIERGGAGGGIAALLNGLYDAEILTSHELVNQITHLDDLVSQADLIIFGEGVKEEDYLLETTTLTIAELAQNIINLLLLFVRLMTNLMSLISTMLQQCLILS